MYYTYTEVVIIMSFFKKLWYIPGWVLAVVNLLFLLIINVMKVVGKGLVYVNNKVSDAGDWVFRKSGRKNQFESVAEAMAEYRSKLGR